MMYEIDVEKLNSIKKQMQIEIADFDTIYQECYKKIDETKEIFDTPTAQFFRENANELILQSQNYISGTVKPFIDNLDIIAKQYEDLFQNIQNLVTTKEDSK